MYYINLNYDFGIFSMADILIFENASMGTTRDNSNFDSEHIQVAFLKYSAFYLFFYAKNKCSWSIRDLLEALLA